MSNSTGEIFQHKNQPTDIECCSVFKFFDKPCRKNDENFTELELKLKR